MSIGPFGFDLVVNAEGYDEEGSEDFARKDVVGARKPFEHVGAGDDRLTVRGNLFPEHLGGGGAYLALRSLMRAGAPQLVVRGDGLLMGWMVITAVRGAGTHLDGAGRPRQVGLEVECMACDQPSAAGVLAALMSLGA